jgi:hypothetical protein
MVAPDRRRNLLWSGIAGPVLFVTAFLVAGATRAGYDPLRHQVSLLSLGDGGDVMVASLIVTGILLIGFALGLRSWLGSGRGSIGAPAAVAVSGIGFVIAGLFSTQPLNGYPPGTPEGMPVEITGASLLHVGGALLLFLGLIAAAAVLGRWFRVAGSTGWASASWTTAIIVLVFFGASSAGPSGEPPIPALAGLFQRISLIAGLGWVAATAVHALRAQPAAGSDARAVRRDPARI